MNIKYGVYLRKSTDSEDRQVQSIDDQRAEAEKLIDRLKLNAPEEYAESKSAKSPGRPEFTRMINDVRSGKINGIICWKLNRLARNPVDGGEIQWLLQQGNLQSVMTPSQEFKSDDNVMMMNVEFGMANQFVLDLSKDVKRGLQTKVSKGWRPGLAPLGYLNDKYEEKGNKKILIDEEKFPLVRKMWDLMLTGNYTVPQITKIVNDKLGLRSTFKKQERKLHTSLVYKIFTNTFYFGEYSYAGEIYQGKHQAMIEPQEYDHVQKLLGRKGRPRSKKKDLPYNGLVRCGECGCSMTADEKIKYIKSEGKTRSYIYHRCSKRKKGYKCTQKPIKHEEFNRQAHEILDKITIPKSFLSFALETLREENAIEEENRNILIKNQEKAMSTCITRIDNLVRLYISPENSSQELLSEAEFKEQKLALLKEKSETQKEFNKISQRIDEWLELTEKTFNFVTYAKYWFNQGDYETKTQILRSLGSNFILKDQKISIKLAKPYKMIEDTLNNIQAENPWLEPTYIGFNKAKTAKKEAVLATLSG